MGVGGARGEVGGASISQEPMRRGVQGKIRVHTLSSALGT